MKFLRKNGGFTLIEMLVASAVSSVILLMVYSAYASIIRSVNQGGIASDYYEEINLVLRRIDSDLVNTYWNEDAKDINFVSEIEGNSSRLNFVTGEYKSNRMILTVKDNYPTSDIHEVGYFIKKDNKSGKYNLIRRNEIHYDSSPLEGGTEEVIFKNVESIKFSFRYNSDWIDTWDSREKKRLPSGIKTTLTVVDPYNNREIYEFYTLCNMSHE